MVPGNSRDIRCLNSVSFYPKKKIASSASVIDCIVSASASARVVVAPTQKKFHFFVRFSEKFSVISFDSNPTNQCRKNVLMFAQLNVLS